MDAWIDIENHLQAANQVAKYEMNCMAISDIQNQKLYALTKVINKILTIYIKLELWHLRWWKRKVALLRHKAIQVKIWTQKWIIFQKLTLKDESE